MARGKRKALESAVDYITLRSAEHSGVEQFAFHRIFTIRALRRIWQIINHPECMEGHLQLLNDHCIVIISKNSVAMARLRTQLDEPVALQVLEALLLIVSVVELKITPNGCKTTSS